ncbi:hypothetical protein UFOVP680_8 [uncultured Caudovirales phage]|uniref:Uncharacterized protein n=1 Tax=uncultured Caudovirales phage TaxID=2100421 RepID=A0A6J5ND74_9CAUD|nr:hypothetical protein UFOVP680_8 [uncultured Caudovirales phage]
MTCPRRPSPGGGSGRRQAQGAQRPPQVQGRGRQAGRLAGWQAGRLAGCAGCAGCAGLGYLGHSFVVDPIDPKPPRLLGHLGHSFVVDPNDPRPCFCALGVVRTPFYAPIALGQIGHLGHAFFIAADSDQNSLTVLLYIYTVFLTSLLGVSFT